MRRTFAPAWSMVSTTCTAGNTLPSARSIMSTGMPRPSSTTVMELSTWMMTSIFFAVTGQRLVHRVVHHLVDQVVQTHFPGRADIHGRPQAHRLQASKYLDVLAGIVAVIFGERCVQGSVAIRVHSLKLSLLAPLEAPRPEELPAGIRGSNRLKDRGFQSNLSVSILPCGARRKEGENGGEMCAKMRNMPA